MEREWERDRERGEKSSLTVVYYVIIYSFLYKYKKESLSTYFKLILKYNTEI